MSSVTFLDIVTESAVDGPSNAIPTLNSKNIDVIYVEHVSYNCGTFIVRQRLPWTNNKNILTVCMSRKILFTVYNKIYHYRLSLIIYKMYYCNDREIFLI